MQKISLTIILIMISLFSNSQSKLKDRFKEANSEMNLRNMYQRIIWDMSVSNEYLFDQKKGEVKYTIEENGYEVITKPKILGTFNFNDDTFLWADKNPSINAELNNNVESFRKTLPKKYQKKKFKSNTDLNENLLSLFSYQLGANGYDQQRQDDTMIYYSLLEIRVFKDGKEIKVMEPKNHLTVLENQVYVSLIKEFHKEKLEVNKLSNEDKIETDEAFKRIKEVHLKYWLNEDSYFYPGLSWPCDFDEKVILDWKEFKTDDERVFVMFTTDLGWTIESYAYEIDSKTKGKKVIINKF